jgi:uncharacterized protein YndB with AHSA1/START domain
MSFATPTDTAVVATRFVEAPVAEVFDAWTIPEHVTRWMLGPPGWTMPICEIDLRPGGAWRFIWRRADGSEMEMRGVYQEIEPPERLVSSETWGEDWPETLNILELSEAGSQTTITHKMLYPSKAARDAALKTGMRDGMAQSFELLEAYLASLF